MSPWGTAWQPRIWSCWCKMTRAQQEPLQNMSFLCIYHEIIGLWYDEMKVSTNGKLRNVIVPMWRRRIPSFSRLAAQRTYMNLKQRGLIWNVLMEHAHNNIPSRPDEENRKLDQHSVGVPQHPDGHEDNTVVNLLLLIIKQTKSEMKWLWISMCMQASSNLSL